MTPASWIALAALTVSAITFLFTVLERIATARATIFSKQLDLIREIAVPYGILCHEMGMLFNSSSDERIQAVLDAARGRIEGAFSRYCELQFAEATILPVAICDFSRDFKVAAEEAFMYAVTVPSDEHVDAEVSALLDEMHRCAAAYLNATRNLLGVSGIIRSMGSVHRIKGRILKTAMARERGDYPRFTTRDPEVALQEFIEKEL